MSLTPIVAAWTLIIVALVRLAMWMAGVTGSGAPAGVRAPLAFLFIGIETRGRTIEELDAALARPARAAVPAPAAMP